MCKSKTGNNDDADSDDYDDDAFYVRQQVAHILLACRFLLANNINATYILVKLSKKEQQKTKETNNFWHFWQFSWK